MDRKTLEILQAQGETIAQLTATVTRLEGELRSREPVVHQTRIEQATLQTEITGDLADVQRGFDAQAKEIQALAQAVLDAVAGSGQLAESVVASGGEQAEALQSSMSGIGPALFQSGSDTKAGLQLVAEAVQALADGMAKFELNPVIQIQVTVPPEAIVLRLPDRRLELTDGRGRQITAKIEDDE